MRPTKKELKRLRKRSDTGLFANERRLVAAHQELRAADKEHWTLLLIDTVLGVVKLHPAATSIKLHICCGCTTGTGSRVAALSEVRSANGTIVIADIGLSGMTLMMDAADQHDWSWALNGHGDINITGVLRVAREMDPPS